MADKTKITWTEATWNPIRGCSKVSAGCAHCYAESMASRFCGPGQPYEGLIDGAEPDGGGEPGGPTRGHWNGTVRLVPEHLDDPLRWRRPRRIFVNSMSDIFHEALSFQDIAAIFGVMAAAPQHTFQILTKRAARMEAWFRWIEQEATGLLTLPLAPQLIAADEAQTRLGRRWTVASPTVWPLPNVWVGVSVEDQTAAHERIPFLLRIPAAVRWLSCEPLLGPVDLTAIPTQGPDPIPMNVLRRPSVFAPHIHWVVAGGESGPLARPMHPDWPRGLRNQCAHAGTPYLMKQLGEWGPSGQHPGTGEPVYLTFPDPGAWLGPGASGLAQGDRFLDASGKAVRSGADAEGAAYPVTALRRIGKKAAGRLLDGRVHEAYPERANGGEGSRA
jgi:protein gp37